MTPCGKILKLCSESFHRDTNQHVVFKFREIWPKGNRWNRALFSWQKILPSSPAVATVRIAPKICQGKPPIMYSRVLQMSSKSVHFQPSYSQMREHRQKRTVKWIPYSAEAYLWVLSRIINTVQANHWFALCSLFCNVTINRRNKIFNDKIQHA